MKLQLGENTLNAYINKAIKEELNERGIIVTPFTDKLNWFLYEKIYDICQTMDVGPQTDSAVEFYEEVIKDKELLNKIANMVIPVISSETGIPPVIIKPMVIFILKDTAKDANKTFSRIEKRKTDKKIKQQLSEQAFKKMVKQIIMETLNK